MIERTINTADLYKIVSQRKKDYGELGDVIEGIVEEMVDATPKTERIVQDFTDRCRECGKTAITRAEPCEDAVSRKAVLDTLDKMDSVLDEDRTVETYKELLIACYNDLPSVTPTRKKGKWVNKSQKSGCGITFVASECTCCGKKTFFDCDQLVYNYCPNCGAEMESEE